MDQSPKKSEAIPATPNHDFIEQARKAVNRAGYVFIYPPKGAIEVGLPALLSAIKNVKALERKPGDLSRYKIASKSLLKASKKFKSIGLTCTCRGDYEDSMAILDVAFDLEKSSIL